MSDDLKQRLAVLAARIETCDKLTWGEDSAATTIRLVVLLLMAVVLISVVLVT